MALPDYTMRQLLEAGVHFGHHTPGAGTRRWRPYIYGVRNGIHIIDLEQTVPLLRQGLEAIREGSLPAAAGIAGRHQAPGAGGDHRGRQALRPVWRQLPLARRHADQLQDDLATIKRLREFDERITEEQSGLTKRSCWS
jgi:small subunit ribosomal protein S2